MVQLHNGNTIEDYKFEELNLALDKIRSERGPVEQSFVLHDLSICEGNGPNEDEFILSDLANEILDEHMLICDVDGRPTPDSDLLCLAEASFIEIDDGMRSRRVNPLTGVPLKP